MASLRLTQEIPRSHGSEVRTLFRKMKKAGCWWGRAANGHWKVYDGPQGRWVTTVGKDTGDPHNLQNCRHDLRRAGVTIS